jgi:thiamine-phosphate pyrophosphorylase
MFNSMLYTILDTKVISENKLDILNLADKLCKYGVDILQLRDKELCDRELLKLSQKLCKIIRKRRKIFIVNDRVDITYLCGADGLHLGKDDIPTSEARKILGRKKIIGKTIHSLAELTILQREKVDYLSIGPVFATKTKPMLPPLRKTQLRNMFNKARKSTFAIGGINLYNIKSLLSLGIQNVAICRGIILAKNLKNTVEKFRECLQKNS